MGECVQQLTDPGLAALSEVFDPAALANHLRGRGGVEVVVRHLGLEKLGIESSAQETLTMEKPGA